MPGFIAAAERGSVAHIVAVQAADWQNACQCVNVPMEERGQGRSLHTWLYLMGSTQDGSPQAQRTGRLRYWSTVAPQSLVKPLDLIRVSHD